MKPTVLLTFVALLVSACSKEPQTQTNSEQLMWKQEVQLPDGRIVWVDRASNIAGKRFPEGGENDFHQTLAFINPDTGERIEWSPPRGAVPVMLAIDHGSAYYVAEAVSVGAYNDLGCPNPPYLVYRYADKQWPQVPIGELPAQATERNLQRIVIDDKKALSDGVVTVAEFQAYLKEFPTGMNYRVVSRNNINATAKGCFPSVLMKLGRGNEITERIGIPTSAQGASK